MKMEVEFEVEEVVRYRIKRTYEVEGGGGTSLGFDSGKDYGEFESRDAAERVKESLERTMGDRLREAL